MNIEDQIATEILELKKWMGISTTTENVCKMDAGMTLNKDERRAILDRLDQDRFSTLERVLRLEKNIEQIKLRLQMK